MSNEIESLRSVLATFNMRRERLITAVNKLDLTIAAIEEELAQVAVDSPNVEAHTAQPRVYVPSRQRRPVIGPSPISSGIYKDMAVGNAAVHYLKSKVTTQNTISIVNALRIGGQPAKSKNLYRLIYNTLATRSKRDNPDVEKDGAGWKYRTPQSGE